MDAEKFIIDSLTESSEVKSKIAETCKHEILKSINLIVSAYQKENKVLFCGNGGSAADSQHLAAEFMVRLSHDISRKALGAIALSTDTSFLTAGGNDIGFDNVFKRAVEGLGKKGDILIAISTSGNSINVIKAVEKAKELGVISIGFLGGTGGKLKTLVDIPIVIPSNSVQRIQEGHITIGHIICEAVERKLFAK